MAKLKNPEPKPAKVMTLVRDDAGGYGYEIYEVDLATLGEPVQKSTPDVFFVFLNDLHKKSRELFGL